MFHSNAVEPVFHSNAVATASVPGPYDNGKASYIKNDEACASSLMLGSCWTRTDDLHDVNVAL